MRSIDGQRVDFPARIQSRGLRFGAKHSYLINLGWFATSGRDASAARYISPHGLNAFTRHMTTMSKRLDDANISLVLVLLSPVGMPDCPPTPDPHSRCGWLQADLTLLRNLLDEAKLPYTDLTDLWTHTVSAKSIPNERDWELPVHPDAEGHRLLAEAIW